VGVLMGVVGDDYTGSMMVASMLAADGFRVAYVLDRERILEADADVIVTPTRSRFMPSAEAVDVHAKVADALLAREPRQIFFKYCATFDSTAAGNIGPCADYLTERLGAPYTLFAPGIPQSRVYVLEGHMFVRGRLLSESEKRFDPITPMPDSDLARVLASQTERPVAVISHHLIRGELRETQRWLAAEVADGARYFIADCVAEADLERIAALGAGLPLMTGGDAIPLALASRLRRDAGVVPHEPARLPSQDGPAVVLAGSCGLQTLRQLEHFRSLGHEALTLDLLDSRDPTAIVDEACEWVLARVHHAPVSVQTSADREGVSRAQAALGVSGAATLAEGLLSSLAARLRDAGVRRFVVAGGETSGAVVDALGIVRIDVAPWTRELYCCWGVGEADGPISIMLKAGQIGPVDVFARALQAMSGR
jgi:3-dehydrotetronate 4-kinase